MLNPQQMAAVTYINGPLFVLAGAGSGKTRVITEKIAFLLRECAYPAHSIFAVTFTNKAANEMRARIAKVLPQAQRRGLKVSTFHTLGLRIIKSELAKCALRRGFSIFDSDDCQQLIRSFLPAAKASEKSYVYQIQQLISRWKNEGVNPEQASSLSATSEVIAECALIFKHYDEALRAFNAVDFDDLIRLPVQLLERFPEVQERWQNRIRHLLIDEYQDSNSSQYLLVKLLTGARQQFTVVGDDDQSIYAWRGAQPENLALLQSDYPQLKLIKLEQNYRSTGIILQAANTLIANNPHIFEKKLWSSFGSGAAIRILCCKDEQHEAEQVVSDLISHKLRFGKNYCDYAILYRGNHQARIFEKSLRHYGVNYRISGGESWFAKTEVRDIFAYLKLLCNPQDDAAYLRAINTPKRGIGSATLTALGNYAHTRGESLLHCSDHLALHSQIAEKSREALFAFKKWLHQFSDKLNHGVCIDTLKQLVEECGYEAYVYSQQESPAKAQKCMDNVWELIEWIGRLATKNSEHRLADIINKLILIDILEQADEENSECVHMLTLHAAKGLEFPFVYLVGVEEQLLPHRASIENEQVEEERRLAYVGITRAQKELCISLAKQRRRGGELEDCLPSRFLDELPEKNLEWYGRRNSVDKAQSHAIARSHLDGLKTLLDKPLKLD